ncbi:MAG TPA: CHAD domain-containing protein [Thermoleophilaceae bacterium]
MARAADVAGIGPDTPFREAAAVVVETRAEELFSLQENVLDTDDIERVHDMRVASRRLRAVLEVFAPCFPKKGHRAVLRDVKAIADALGERRDPDVAIDILVRVEDALPTHDAAGLRGVVDELRERQQQANERLAEALRQMEETGLRGRIAVLVAHARGSVEEAAA